MSYRVERKIRCSNSELIQIRKDLICRGMTPLFDERQVNSMYYDTPDLDCFRDSEEGLLPRKNFASGGMHTTR